MATLTKTNTIYFVLIFTYKTFALYNLSNNFDKKFIEDLNYLYHRIIHSGMFQTFWTSFNTIAYTTNTEIFYKKPCQIVIGLNLKVENYQYLIKLWNISS